MFETLLLWLLTTVGCAIATPLQSRAGPTVTLDNATVLGYSAGAVNQFFGIPYAQPPTGNLRFKLPQPLQPYNTSFSAVNYGSACPQQVLNISYPPLPTDTTDALSLLTQYILFNDASEDCLTLNVIAPADATPDSNFPVVVFIYDGAFQVGGTSSYNGNGVVENAISQGRPVIYVSMNYRLNAFGFLASQEVKDAGVGNLGLQDQRQALRWVQKYITAFGGDPTKVTIWGEGAGSISVGLQMVTNNGNPEGLFRAAFMSSGSPLPLGNITEGQPSYDTLVQMTGCSNTADTLQCLREAPYHSLINAINQSPFPTFPGWQPVVDGVFLTDDPPLLVVRGSVANIPVINGDCDDEGTLFSLVTLNITNDTEFLEYAQTYYPNVPASLFQQLPFFYPNDIAQGSPFDTGDSNALTPQFKRVAAFVGDALFQAPRRAFLQSLAGSQNVWTFLSKRVKTTPYLGSLHGSDMLSLYAGSDMTSYLVRFVNDLDPNPGQSEIFGTDWTPYTIDNPTMMEFLDGPVSQVLTNDTYRLVPIEYLMFLMARSEG